MQLTIFAEKAPAKMFDMLLNTPSQTFCKGTKSSLKFQYKHKILEEI